MQTKGLVNDELALQKLQTFRAACLFPIFDLEKTDLIFLFQNYWKWKRSIKINFTLVIRNLNGEEIFFKKFTPKESNYISVRKILTDININLIEIREGTAEVSILSDENIIFPFPAIWAFYKQINGKISLVHSAGRTLEVENLKRSSFCETNFFVNLEDIYDPFIHLFNGPKGKINNIKLEVWEASNEESIFMKKFDINEITKPYESKILYLKKYLNQDFFNKFSFVPNSEKKIFVKLFGDCESIYPRFICGNIHKKDQIPFVTHSYRDIKTNDDTLIIDDIQKCSTIALPLIDELDLSTFIYPTTNPESTNIELKLFDLDKNRIMKENFKLDARSGKGNLFELKSGVNYPQNRNVGLVASAVELPARIHVNLMYKCKTESECCSTDIALDFAPHVSKFKKNYWGDGLFVDSYKNAVFLSNFKSTLLSDKFSLISEAKLKFKFFLYLNNFNEWKMKEFEFKGESKSNVLFIEELSNDLFGSEVSNKANHFSWRIELIDGFLQDVYLISFNIKEGYIYGDHSF